MQELAPGVKSDPDVMSGAACIAGRRITPNIISGYFVRGKSIAQIVDMYCLTSEQVEAALRYEFSLRIPISKDGLKPSRKTP